MVYFALKLGIRALKCFSNPLVVGKGGVTLDLQVSHWDYFRALLQGEHWGNRK